MPLQTTRRPLLRSAIAPGPQSRLQFPRDRPNAAVASDVQTAERLTASHVAAVFRRQGDSHHGCKADQGPEEDRVLAAPNSGSSTPLGRLVRMYVFSRVWWLRERVRVEAPSLSRGARQVCDRTTIGS